MVIFHSYVKLPEGTLRWDVGKSTFKTAWKNMCARHRAGAMDPEGAGKVSFFVVPVWVIFRGNQKSLGRFVDVTPW